MQSLRASAGLARAAFGRSAAHRPIFEELKGIFAEETSKTMAEMKDLKAKYGDQVLSGATVGAAYEGMRGVTAMTYEPSLLDPQEGIRFRGLSIPECQEQLPKRGTQMTPEAMTWLLMTGRVPTQAQADAMSEEFYLRLTENSAIMKECEAAVDALPKDLHPMSQFAAALLVLQKDSKMAEAYNKGVHKKTLWEYSLDDALNAIARCIAPAAQIYRRTFHDGVVPAPVAGNDWSANFGHMMGFSNQEFHDCLRMYLCIHTDHEGGNVSAHTAVLVSSALSDPYRAFSAAMCGLAGPLHGLANQEVLNFLLEFKAQYDAADPQPKNEQEKRDLFAKLVKDTLKAGRVVPGYGHAVLRKTDPRYEAQRQFALQHMPNDALFHQVSMGYDIIPPILEATGKVKNPWPNVDAHSGVLLQHYGLTEQDFYTVLFGVARGIGVLSAAAWDRAMLKPLERPKSITTEALIKQAKAQNWQPKA
jgi:citrate synthase